MPCNSVPSLKPIRLYPVYEIACSLTVDIYTLNDVSVDVDLITSKPFAETYMLMKNSSNFLVYIFLDSRNNKANKIIDNSRSCNYFRIY